jgi:hypothetical protein
VSVTKGQVVEEDVTLVPVPPPPPKLPPPAPVADPYVGLYANFNAVGLFPLTGQPSLDPCSPSGASCSTSGIDMRVGAKLSVGYAWGVFGFELVGAFLYDLQHELDRNVTGKGAAASNINLDTDDTVSRNETHKLGGWATFFGIGPRITSKDDAVRFTMGSAFGGVYRVSKYSLDVLGGAYTAPNVSSFSPALVVDAGLLLGSTPGTKFTLGVMAWVELSQSKSADAWTPPFPATGAVRVQPRSQELVTGAQFFIGPTLGLQFGR